ADLEGGVQAHMCWAKGMDLCGGVRAVPVGGSEQVVLRLRVLVRSATGRLGPYWPAFLIRCWQAFSIAWRWRCLPLTNFCHYQEGTRDEELCEIPCNDYR